MAATRMRFDLLKVFCMGVFFPCLAPLDAADGNYRDLFVWTRSLELPQKRLGRFPARIVEKGTDRPVPGARVGVLGPDSPLVWESDSQGIIWIPYDPKLYRANPPLRVEPGGVEFEVRFTATATESNYQKVEWRTGSDLEKLGDARVAVFHREGDGALAREVLAEMIRCHASVKEVLGIEPVSTAAILETGKKENRVLYLAFSEPGYRDTWMCFQDRWKSGEFGRVHAHEVAESTLVAALPLYEDPRNRFIGDGIAEWVSWSLQGLPSDYLEYLSPEKTGEADTVDLLEVFQAGKRLPGKRGPGWRREHAGGYAPGYALSFAFWHALTEEHGAGLIQEFVAQIQGRGAVSAEESLAILSRLTGDPQLGRRVRSVSVGEARTRIESLMKSGQ